MSISKKTVLPIAVIVISILVASMLVLTKPDVKTEKPEPVTELVRVEQLKRSDVFLSVKSQGNVQPRTESPLVAQASGQVVWTSPFFVNGGSFNVGDVLLKIESRDYEYAVAQAESQVAQAELQLSIQEQEAKVARQEWERLNNGEAPPLVARKPQLQQARAALAAAKASLGQARLNLERTQIRAPYEGRVRRKNVDLGQFITPGQAVASIYATDYVEIRLPIQDQDLAFLNIPFDFNSDKAGRRGPRVELKAEFAGEPQHWSGYITRIESEIDSRSRMVHAVAKVENPYRVRGSEAPLAIGLFVYAEIMSDIKYSVFVVPRAALREKNQVFVVDENNTLRYREVDVFRTDAEKAYIRSGVEAGESLSVSPLSYAIDGMKVSVFSSKNGGEKENE